MLYMLIVQKSVLYLQCTCCPVMQDSCRDLLAVMLSPSSITIWNASTGTKVSRFTFTETIVSFVFNPFQPENLVCELTSELSVLWQNQIPPFLLFQCSRQSVLSLSMTLIQAATQLEEGRSFTSPWGRRVTRRYQGEGRHLLGFRESFSQTTNSS